ncbi:hypothetical protein ACFRQM_17145 [Streptomyces sp. NPDC056831]|uniref:hypothetical protein n=1 Tax=Streptomyces sp. NPDC056831 TaxID=3345954 RepID=UPI003696531C
MSPTLRAGATRQCRGVRDWDTYREPWTAALQHFGGYDPQTAEQALHTVLPDVLRYDRTKPAAYPDGRTLTDDVTSARLAMLTNGKVGSDHIGPHTDLLPEFPYLGSPHPAPPAVRPGRGRRPESGGLAMAQMWIFWVVRSNLGPGGGSDREHR